MKDERTFLKVPRLRTIIDDEFRFAGVDKDHEDRIRWLRPGVIEILWSTEDPEKQAAKLEIYRHTMRHQVLSFEPGRMTVSATYPNDVPETFRRSYERPDSPHPIRRRQ